MPYYLWNAINLQGVTSWGTLYASNKADLEHKLFLRQLGLIHAYRTISFASLMVTKKEKAQALKDLAQLLQVKIPIYQASNVVASLQTNQHLRQVLASLAENVYRGISFDKALASHSELVDPSLVGMIRVGQETGKLDQTLDKLGEYMLFIERLKNELRSLLFMPLMTLGAFLLLCFVTLFYLIPQFEPFFLNAQQELPILTQRLVWLSQNVREGVAWLYIMIVIIILATLIMIIHRYRYYCIMVLMYAGLGSYIVTWNIAYVLRLLAMLTGNGISLPEALAHCSASIKNPLISADLYAIEQAIVAGSPIAYATQHSRFFGKPDIQAILELDRVLLL